MMLTNEGRARRGALIAITGIDGAGKSTLAAALHQELVTAGHDVVFVGKHTIDVPSDAALSRYLDSLNAVVYRRPAEVAAACGDRYWLLALGAWYTLQDRLVVGPALAAGATVIIDNTHHKIAARYAVNPELLTALVPAIFSDITPADLVLLLDVDPKEALRRKGNFTSLEAGHSGSAEQDFVAYQAQVTQALYRQRTTSTWATIEVTDKPPRTVLSEALALLAQRGVVTASPMSAP